MNSNKKSEQRRVDSKVRFDENSKCEVTARTNHAREHNELVAFNGLKLLGERTVYTLRYVALRYVALNVFEELIGPKHVEFIILSLGFH